MSEVAEDIRTQIQRCHELAARCMAQVADGDLSRVDRESAHKRALLAIKTRRQLEDLLALETAERATVGL